MTFDLQYVLAAYRIIKYIYISFSDLITYSNFHWEFLDKKKFPVFRHLAQIWVSQVIYFNFIDFPVKQCSKIFKIHQKWNFLFVWQRLNSPSSHTGTYTELSGTKAWVALQLYTSYMLVIFICFSKKKPFQIISFDDLWMKWWSIWELFSMILWFSSAYILLFWTRYVEVDSRLDSRYITKKFINVFTLLYRMFKNWNNAV